MIGTDAFQETPIVEVTRQITKHNYLVMDVRDLPRIVKEVCTCMLVDVIFLSSSICFRAHHATLLCVSAAAAPGLVGGLLVSVLDADHAECNPLHL